MRFLSCVVTVLAACSDVEVDEFRDHRDPMDPDGGGSTHVADALPIPPDGIPANLTPCEEAAYHSDLAWIQDKIFNESCTTKCHGDSPPAAMMSLLAGQSRAALVNVPSTGFSGWIRVVPGDPAHSMLMVQLGGEPGPALEGTMPWGQPKLCDGKIDAVRRWIAAGANP
jgi:hypothetical protein